MPIARRVKSNRATSVSTLTVSFDESTPLDNTYTLFAVVSFSGVLGDIQSNSWGTSPVTGSGSNGSANYLGAFIMRGNGTTNDFTITLNAAASAIGIDLYAFDQFVSTTVESGGSGNPASSTTASFSGGTATSGPNRIAIAGVSLSSSVTFSESWTNGFETNTSPISPSRLDTAVLAIPTAGTVPTTSTTFNTARAQRIALWYIQGMPASTAPAVDTTAPAVSIVSPANGAVVSGSITLTATATDAVGVTGVKFYFEDTLIGSASNTSGSTWSLSGVASSAVADGPYALQARATDAAGNVGETEVFITVRNTASPTGPTSRIRQGNKDAKTINRALRIYLGQERIFGSVYTPPVNGGTGSTTAQGIPAQSEMPTDPYALYSESLTYAWSTSSGPMSSPFQWVSPSSEFVKLAGHASKGTVAGSISGFVRPNALQDATGAGTGTNPLVIPPYQIRVKTNSSDIYFRLAQRDYSGMSIISSRASVQLKVNGKLTSVNPLFLGTNPGYPANPENITAGQYYFKVSFPSTAERVVELMTHLDFGGLAVNSGATLSTPPAPAHRIAFIDGSLTGAEKHQTGNFALTGGSSGSYTAMSSWAFYAAHALAYDDFVNSATGSSGYAIQGDTVSFKVSTKIPQDVTAHNPDTVFVGNPNNDIAAGRTVSEFTTDVNNVFSAVKAANPNALRICMGGLTPPIMGTQAEGEAIVAPYNAAMKTAAQTHGFWFINPSTGQTYNPSGTLVSTTSNWISGASGMIASDNQHPNQAGSRMIADKFVAAIKAAHAATPSGTTPTPTPTPTPGPVSSGAPTRQTSFGPNGTHWPSQTPWVRDPELVVLPATACTWAAIKTQIDTAVSTYPNAKVKITVPPGTLTGNGSGATSSPVLQNVGAVNRTWRILVVPRDGAFSVTHSGSARIDRVKGVSFAGFSPWGLGVAEADAYGVVFTECTDVAWGWSKTKFFNVTTSSTSYTPAVTNGVTFFECVAPEQGFFSGDRCAFRNGPSLDDDPNTNDYPGGITKNVVIDGCWYSAVYKPKGSTAHCDALQLSGRTSQFHGITIRDTYMNGATNAVFITTGDAVEQTETTRDVLLDHVALVGGLRATNMYPLPSDAYAMTGGPIALNGQPVNAEIKDCLISGSVFWSDVRKVTNTLVTSSPPAPASGSYTQDSNLFATLTDITNRGITKPTDSSMQSIWLPLTP